MFTFVNYHAGFYSFALLVEILYYINQKYNVLQTKAHQADFVLFLSFIIIALLHIKHINILIIKCFN